MYEEERAIEDIERCADRYYSGLDSHLSFTY